MKAEVLEVLSIPQKKLQTIDAKREKTKKKEITL